MSASPDGEKISLARAATHRLAGALRRANALAMATAAGPEILDAATRAIEDVCRQLESLPMGRELEDGVHSFDENSPMHGPANPLAPPMELHMVGERVVGTVRFSLAYQGPPGFVHGGYVAAAFDDVLGLAQMTAPHPGPTVHLAARLRRGAPIERELRVEAWIERIEGRKIFTSATIHDGETLVAEGEALFISRGPAAPK